MEFEGKYRVKSVLLADENGTRTLSRQDLEGMEKTEETADFVNMLKMLVEISESALTVKMILTPEDVELVRQNEPDMPIDDNGVAILEQHEVRSEDGEWQYECGEEDGETNYMSLRRDENGDVVYGGMITLEKI